MNGSRTEVANTSHEPSASTIRFRSNVVAWCVKWELCITNGLLWSVTARSHSPRWYESHAHANDGIDRTAIEFHNNNKTHSITCAAVRGPPLSFALLAAAQCSFHNPRTLPVTRAAIFGSSTQNQLDNSHIYQIGGVTRAEEKYSKTYWSLLYSFVRFVAFYERQLSVLFETAAVRCAFAISSNKSFRPTSSPPPPLSSAPSSQILL